MRVDPVGLADLDLVEAGGTQGGAELGFGERACDASRPGGHVGTSLLVHVVIGDHVRYSEAPRRVGARGAASRMTLGLSPERLITQLEMTTSTAESGKGHRLDVALEELDVLDAGVRGVVAGELEHFVSHIQPYRPSAGPHALGADQYVRAGARAEVDTVSPSCRSATAVGTPHPSDAPMAVAVPPSVCSSS